MNQIRLVIFSLLVVFFGCKDSKSERTEISLEKPEKIVATKPTVSFTFDDGNTSNLAGFQFEEWNKLILSHLENENLKSVFFVTGKNKSDKKGQFLLKSWNDNGHKIANHSFSHPFYNSEKNDSQLFESELNKTDAVISNLSNAVKLFRFPYLVSGRKRQVLQEFKEKTYRYLVIIPSFRLTIWRLLSLF